MAQDIFEATSESENLLIEILLENFKPAFMKKQVDYQK